MSGLHIKKLNHVFAILRYVSGKNQYRFFAESEIYICFCYDEIRCVTDEKRRIKKNTTQKSYVFRCFFKFSDVFFGFPMLSVKNPTFWVKFLDLFP